MIQKSKIAILGGGGRTGKFLVTELLQQGYALKLLLRAPENFPIQHHLIEIIKGDATDPQAIHDLLKDCDAIISTLGQRQGEPMVASQATQHILKVMGKNKIRRYILVAGINIDTPSDKKSMQTLAATAYMKSNFPTIQEDRQKAYSLLSDCDLDWTLVRVPMIEFSHEKQALKVSLEDCLGSKITAGSIASFLVQQLQDDRYTRGAPFISNE